MDDQNFRPEDQPRDEFIADSSTGGQSGGRSPSLTLVPEVDLPAGTLVADRYRILSMIGRGAMGSVYKVEQIFLKKRFAMKTINCASLDSVAAKRFKQEAQAASLLDHPNAVQAVDYGLLADCKPFLVMEYLKGKTLKQYLKSKGTLTADEALEIFIPICFAIADAHDKGIVHRDIKPSNIVLSEGGEQKNKIVPKIVDFGIAKLQSVEDSEALTRTGEVFGTPFYMSPEQCAGLAVDSRSDIYSLGCVLFEALTGAPPFAGQTPLETMMRHRSEEPPSLASASLGASFAVSLERVVAKMLAKDPVNRYQTCLAVAQALISLNEESFGMLRSLGVPGSKNPDLTRKDSRSKGLQPQYGLVHLLAVAFSCIVLTAAGAYFYFAGQKQSPPPVVPVARSRSEQTKKGDEALVYAPTIRLGGDSDALEKQCIGKFIWWKNGVRQRQDAVLKSEFPHNAKLILEANIQLISNPQYLLEVPSRDLTGLVVDVGKDVTVFATDRSFNGTLMFLQNFNDIRAVELCFTPPVSEGALDQIGALPKLHWLVLKDSERSAEKIARLKNLDNLYVLSLKCLDRCRPVLKRLSKQSKLRRLQLDISPFSPGDAALVSQLRHIEVLDLISIMQNDKLTDDGRVSILKNLSRMPSLQYLRLERNVFCGEGASISKKVLSVVPRFRHLKMLCLSGRFNAVQIAQLQASVRPACEIGKGGSSEFVNLFDIRSSDPAQDNIW